MTDAARSARADYMREWGRANGAEPIIGERFTCEVCKVVHDKTGKRQRWCAPCKPEGLRRYKIEKRAAEGKEVIGAKLTCRECAAEFIKSQKRQFYCDKCRVIAKAEALPKDRKRQSKYQSARNKRLRNEIPGFAINERISAQVNAALRAAGSSKGGQSWQALVGYSIAELCVHIERQFLPGMTWENRKDWHVDHITPLSSFEYTKPTDPEFRRAWALPNLRPLWARDNIRKSGRRTHLL